MSEGKVKASKVRVHLPPEGTGGLDGHVYVYIYEVFHKAFSGGKAFDTIERAAQFQRHEQERFYLEQEADPELFDLPFLSSDPGLLERLDRDADYKNRLMRDLDTEARQRGRKR